MRRASAENAAQSLAIRTPCLPFDHDMSYAQSMDSHHRSRTPRSILLSFRFLATSLLGALAMALVSVFAELPAQITMLGTLVSMLVGLFLGYLEREDQRE